MKSIRKKLLTVTPIVLAIAAAFGTAPVAQAGAGDPLGPPFLVTNPAGPPAIARNASGEFIIVWTDPSTQSVCGRRYASDGSSIDAIPLQLSHPASSNILDSGPAVGIAANGDFVVTWLRLYNSDTGVPPPQGIFAQRYSSSGNPAGAEFSVEATTGRLDAGFPSVAMDSEGDFMIAWRRTTHQSIVGFGYLFFLPKAELADQAIVAQRFNADGSAINQEPFIVDKGLYTFAGIPLTSVNAYDYSALNQAVDVAIDDSGDSVVVWSSYAIESIGTRHSSSIYARSYDRNGKSKPRPTVVASDVQRTESLKLPPSSATRSGRIEVPGQSVAMDSSGDYVVSWADTSYQSIAPIRARQFAKDGSPLSDELEFGTPVTRCTYVPPSVASDAGGNFVVAFQSCDFIIEAQRFTKGGAPAGGLFTVSTDSSHQSYAAVASDANGDFVVTWFSPYQNNAILARLFSGY